MVYEATVSPHFETREQWSRLGHDGQFARLRQLYGSAGAAEDDLREIENLIHSLVDRKQRDSALYQLSWKVQIFPNLGPWLGFTTGTIGIFQEALLGMHGLIPYTLICIQATRVIYVLVLLECVASHADTKTALVYQAQIIDYLVPFLETGPESELLEYLRFHSLKVIEGLLIVPEIDVVRRLLYSGTMPLFLRAMEEGAEPSKISATFILHRILTVYGAESVFTNPRQLDAVFSTLDKVATALAEKPSEILYRLVIKCYLRISQDVINGMMGLRVRLPLRILEDELFRPYNSVEYHVTASLRQCLIRNLLMN